MRKTIFQKLGKTNQAQKKLNLINEKIINKTLKNIAQEILNQKKVILAANLKDLKRMDKNDPKYDRLELNEERLKNIARDIQKVARLSSPVNTLIESRELANKLKIKRIKVPIGTIAVIYEARPNVTPDVFSLCFKTRNACVLKGGSDAKNSNEVIINIIQSVLKKNNIDPNCVYLAPHKRKAIQTILKADKHIDVIIPRGSQSLIDFVRKNATVPVIETGAGIVHIYVDARVNVKEAAKIIHNAKTRRPSVCNSLDTLLVHKAQTKNLSLLCEPLIKNNVEIFADPIAYKKLKNNYPKHLLKKAYKKHFGTEFLSLKMSIKTVNNLNQAIEHIQNHSSKHSEAILSKNAKNVQTFFAQVDAAVVYANASTAFTDGAQFGLGAEIGISTQKLHARGPMGLDALTSYKWIIEGSGQTRNV